MDAVTGTVRGERMKEYIVSFIDDAYIERFDMIYGTNGELIRCKECRYHDGRNRCEMWDMHKTDANDFCSSAERELET
jgi:hypothetical protein